MNDSRHASSKVPYGFVDGTYVGFMDDLTPVRVKQEPSNRLSNLPDRVWFQLRPTFIDVNLTKVFPGPPDKYGYCAYDISSSRATCSWFSITKSLNGRYPTWANQFDIWAPVIPKSIEAEYYSLCFSFVLAENRCVVTKFEADNPVPGTPEVFVDNPLAPGNPQSFWSTTLDDQIADNAELAKALVDKIKELYRTWNRNYCKGQWLTHVGLQNEPYFKYFSYPDFLTPYSGLIQIRKHAELEGHADLLILFQEINALSKRVKDEIYRILVEECEYFE